MLARYQLAKKVAKAAGKLALSYQEKALTIEAKGIQDFVTQADQQVEKQIRQALQAAYPEDGFFGEESESDVQQGQAFWAVDPIDGTSNYMRKVDQWGISIAYVVEGAIQIAVIYDPVRDILYHARRGNGAFCNEQQQYLNAETPIDPTLILGHSRRAELRVYLDILQHLHQNNIEHRKFGSAALGLAQVISGHCDGYFEADLNPWDCLAGLLLIEEAGGVVICGNDMAKTLQNGPVAAGIISQSALLQQLLKIAMAK
ncbi:MAG: inositol monophosphatase [Oceanospirillaceae bacterium]|nr:inositol monophosphatase [Oceanospirillaceae bacterium]